MATTVTVFETAARRTVIKVSPGKYLHEIRAEACEKFRLDPDKYGLKHNNKTLDISTQFRLSGLPSGAKLELIQLSRSAGVVTVGLQLPQSEAASVPNGRLVDKLASTTTLWQVLRKFEDGAAGAGGPGGPRNLTARGVPKMDSGAAGAGRLYYEQPVLTVANREYGTFVELQKTLSALGFSSGNVLIKLAYQVSDQPLEEAQTQIGRYFDEIEGSRRELEEGQQSDQQAAASTATAPGTSSTPAVPTEAGVPGELPASAIDVGPEVPVAVEEPTPVAIEGVSDRPITVYSAPSNSTPKAATASFDPADYEFTIDHAKTQAAMYQTAGRNKPLPSDAEIEAQKAAASAKLALIPSVQIKVRFPDQTAVVTEFTQSDTSKELYEWVRRLMTHADADFMLRWQGPKGMTDVPVDSKRLIQDVGMVGRVQLTLVWKEGSSMQIRRTPVLKDRVSQVAQEIEVKGLPEPGRSVRAEAESRETPEAPQEERKKKAMPAWLKKSLPGKK